MKNIFKFGILSVIIVILSQFAFSFGVSSPYWKENPLIMYPGQTQNVALSLQNLIGGEDMVVHASIEEGSSIARLKDKKTEYLIPFGSKDVYVNVEIFVPAELRIGQNVSVGIMIQETTAGKKGEMLRTVSGVKHFIPVIVKAESEVPKPKVPERSPFLTSIQWDLIWIILVVIIVLAVVFEERRHNKKKKRK